MSEPGAPPIDIALVAMPFLPVLSPSLGLSQLKAELVRAGRRVEVIYPSLDFFEEMCRFAGPVAAEFDYNLLASATDIGETVFAAALWDDSALENRAVQAISLLLNTSGKVVEAETMSHAIVRLLQLPAIGTAFIDRVAEAQDWSRFRIVGFSSVFSQQTASLALARRIKARHPEVTILFGGPNLDGEMGEACLESFSFIDAVLRGEADVTLTAFVAARTFEDRVRIPGLLWREAGDIQLGAPARPVNDLDARAIPDFADWFRLLARKPIGKEVQERITLPIETSRGCWWGAVSHCVFCGLNPTTMAFRSKSPNRAMAEFDAQAKRWGVRRFFAVDNILDMTYFQTLLPDLETRGFTVFYETKSNLKEKHVAQLARAGVRAIQPGIEGLNTEILKLMRKGASGRQGIELLKWCRLYGVDPLWFYLYGFPEERAEPYLADIEIMSRLWHLPPPKNPNPIVLDRYSPLYRDRARLGLEPLIPPENSAIYYAPLSNPTRLRLAYHFENRASEAAVALYERPLWRAVMLWNWAAKAGAYLVHVQGAGITLTMDGRRPDQPPRVRLLTGQAHELYSELRTGRRLEAVKMSLPRLEPDPADFALTLTASAMLPEILDGTTRQAAFDALDDAGLVVAIDGLVLALGTELTRGDLADHLDLSTFAVDPLQLGRRPEAAEPLVPA